MIEDQLAKEILINTGVLSAISGVIIAAWHDFKTMKVFPPLETTTNPKEEIKEYQTKKNIRDRGNFIALAVLLSGFVGVLLGLYWVGFSEADQIPNKYQRAFWALLAGFVMPTILAYIEKMKIKELTSRLKGG